MGAPAWLQRGVYGPPAGAVLVRRRHAHRAPRRPERPPLPPAGPAQRRPRAGLALLCLLLWLPGFFTLPAGDRDESRFAQASRQMVETGDYVRIRFGEVERNKKPAGIHWLQAAAVHAAGGDGPRRRGDIWAYRVPCLLGALLAVLATFHFGRALVGRRAAFLGAAMLAACLVLVVETHIAKTDAALLGDHRGAMGLIGAGLPAPRRLHRAAGGGVLAGARRVGAAEGADRADGAAAGRGHPARSPTAAPRPGCARCGRAGACR